MFLRYPHRTHRPRPSGSLILTMTRKKDMTCPENIPISSTSSFPVCSSTKSTQCPCTSRNRTPTVIPRALGLGALGCRISGSLGVGGLENLFVVIWTLGLLLVWLLSHLFSQFGFTCPFSCSSTTLKCLISTSCAFKKLIKSGPLLLLAGVCVSRIGRLGPLPFSWAVGKPGVWFEIGRYWVLEARAAGSFCLTSQMLDFPLPIAGFYWSDSHFL